MGKTLVTYSGEEIFTAQPEYYAVSENSPITFRLSFELFEAIDPNALRFAADRCFERYPYLMVRTEVTEKAIRLKYNNFPIVVKETRDALMLNSEETNFHLIALTFYDRSLSLSAFHGLMAYRWNGCSHVHGNSVLLLHPEKIWGSTFV